MDKELIFDLYRDGDIDADELRDVMVFLDGTMSSENAEDYAVVVCGQLEV